MSQNIKNKFYRQAAKKTLVASLLLAATAHAELLLDQDMDDRENTRQTMETVNRAEVTVHQHAPVGGSVTQEVDHVSLHEMKRRERMRMEIKNEDLLQSRLEELRLKEERRREDEILQASLERNSQDSSLASHPVAPSVEIAQGSQLAQNNPQISTQSAVSADAGDQDEGTKISIMPKFGVNALSTSSGYSVSPRFSMGAAIELKVTDSVSLEAGYSYGESGIQMASSNPYIQMIQYQFPQGGSSSDTLVLKQNIIDLAVKVYVLSPSSRFRPYVSVGGAYGRSYLNYDDRIRSYLASSPYGTMNQQDYTMDQFMAALGVGAEFKLSKQLSINAGVKYFNVLSSRQNTPINNAAFYAPGVSPWGGYRGAASAWGGGMQSYDPDRQIVGGSLERAGIFQVQLGVAFTF